MDEHADHHVVIGTAGHVDHGKTALVKALTGTDTDRWKEEKQRGITIDLGFAQLDLGNGSKASVVDVPGHEDFVRNMVAGATGVDVALLVVAADESIMPQTIEHLAILEFLGIRTGVVAVTKKDLAEPEWLELVMDEIRERTVTSRIDWEPPVAVSAVTGEGLDDLRSALTATAAKSQTRATDDLFRMPVDRVFSVAGAGTVVTGTVWAGQAIVGDTVRVLPSEAAGRVRSIEVHGTAADRAIPGRRTALALVGLDRADAPRGSMVVVGDAWQSTRRVDVHVNLLPNARPLTQRSRIRFHIGTAEVMARVTPATDVVEPGGEGVIRLRLESSLVCRWGDRGVIRAYSPVTTVGGCLVIDPAPDPRPRRPITDPRRMSSDPRDRIAAAVEIRGEKGLEARELDVRVGVPDSAVSSVLPAVQSVVREGTTLLPRKLVRKVVDSLLGEIEAYHRAEPSKPGLPLETFREHAGTSALADYARRELEASGAVVFAQGYVRLADHKARLEGRDQEFGSVLLDLLVKAGGQGATAAELSERIPDRRAIPIAEFFVSQDTVVRIGPDRYLHRHAIDELTRRTVAHLRKAGEASPADLRDILGLTRKYLIPVLGWLDGQGITVRSGDVRRLGPKAHLV